MPILERVLEKFGYVRDNNRRVMLRFLSKLPYGASISFGHDGELGHSCVVTIQTERMGVDAEVKGYARGGATEGLFEKAFRDALLKIEKRTEKEEAVTESSIVNLQRRVGFYQYVSYGIASAVCFFSSFTSGS